MIDRHVFLEQMTALSEWYDVDLKAKVKLFYTQVNKNLSTEEFVIACDAVMAQERFFPPAAVFIEKVYGTRETQAYSQLEMISASCQEMSIVGKKALEAVGGQWNFTRSTTAYHILVKEFVKAFMAFSINEPIEAWALPPSVLRKALDGHDDPSA